MFNIFILLIVVIEFVVAKIKVKFINADSSLESSFRSLCTDYSALSTTAFEVEYENVDETNGDKVNETYSLISKDYQFVFSYMPNISPELLNSISAHFGMASINIAYSSHTSCLSHTSYGFDSCHSKFLVINKLKSRYRQNIILGPDDICNNQLKVLLTQFANNGDLTMLKTDATVPEVEDHINNNIKPKLGNEESVIIYNFYPKYAKEITTYISAINTNNNNNIKLIHFDLDRKTVIDTPTDYLDSYIASEFLFVNDSELTSILKPTAATVNVYSTYEIFLFQMLELYSQKYMAKSSLTMNLLYYELYGKTTESLGISYTLLKNNHLISNIYIGIINSTASATPTLEKDMEIVIDDLTSTPSAQITGYPVNMTCSILHSPMYYPLDGIFVILSFYGLKEKGYLSSQSLVAVLTAIEMINKESPVMGKVIIPILIDSAIGKEKFGAQFIQYSSQFKIAAVIIYATIDDLDSLLQYFGFMNLLYINMSPIGGEYCNKYIMNADIPFNTYLSRGIHTLFKQYNNIFILTCNTMLCKQGYSAIKYIISQERLTLRGEYTLMFADSAPSQGACSSILKSCENVECLVVDLCDMEYQVPFFESYKRKELDPEKYPVLTFTVDERVIANSNKTYFENQYVMGYYFNSIRDSSSNILRDKLRDVYGQDPIITSNMAVSFSQIFLLATAINIVYSYEINSIKSVMGYSSYDGPGGKIAWNNEGFSIAQIKLGKINGDGEIDMIDDGFNIPLSYSYSDLTKKCDWVADGNVINRETLKVVFIHITNELTKDYDDYYTQYFTLMINLLNENYGGIDSKIIKGIIPHLSNTDELKSYLDGLDYDEIVAFMGTSTNEERDIISPYLSKYHKLLFNVFPSEGEYSNENVIQMSRIPAHYISIIFGYKSRNLKDLAIVYDSSFKSNDVVVEYIEKYCSSRISMKCRYYPIKTIENINDTVNQIQDDYPNGVGIISIIRKKVENMIVFLNERNMTSNIYPICMTDILCAFITHSKDPDLYKGHFFASSYTYKIDSNTNQITNNFIETKFGEAKYLSTEISINIYQSLMFLRNAVETTSSYDSDKIRDEIYRLTLDLPGGQISVSDSNMCVLSMYLLKCTGNNDYEIVLYPTSLLDIYPISYDFGVNSIQYTYDYSISTEKQVASVYPIGLYIEENVESYSYLLENYISLYNANGGNNGKLFELHVFNCKDSENITKFINRTDVSLAITQCGSENIKSFEQILIERKAVIFAVKNEDSDVCFNQVIFTGTSPLQRTAPMVNYLINHYSHDFLLVLPEYYQSLTELGLLKDTIKAYNGKISNILLINETDTDNATEEIYNEISKIKINNPNNLVIINYLEVYEVYKTVYETVFKLLSPMYNNCNTSKDYSKDYVIVTNSIDLFNQIPTNISIGHLCRSSGYIDKTTSPMIYSIAESVFGKNTYLNEEESTILITFELLGSAIQLRTELSLKDVLHSQPFKTSITTISVGEDNYANIPMYLIQKLEDYNEDETNEEKMSHFAIVSKLYDNYPSDSFREFLNMKDENEICKMGEVVSLKITSLILLVPLTGDLYLEGEEMLISFLIAIDFANSMQRSRYYQPIIFDTENSVEKIKNNIHSMMIEYKTRIFFGIYDSETRKNIIPTLEKEGALLYYPIDYEGLECSKNIIYTGVPFTSNFAYIPYIISELGRNIVIVYSATLKDQTNFISISNGLKERGVSIISSIEVPIDNYEMEKIVNFIVNKMSSGTIISLLDSFVAIDFMKEMYRQKYTDGETYHIVNTYLSRNFVYENIELMNGHYYWEYDYSMNQALDMEQSPFHTFLTQKYSYSTTATIHSGVVFSILINHFTLSMLNETKHSNDEDKNDMNTIIGYAFDDVYVAASNISAPEYSIHIDSSNHLSFGISLTKVSKSKTDSKFVRETVYKYDSIYSANTWDGHYYFEDTTKYYVCNWNKYNTDIYSEPTLLVALLVSISGAYREVEYTEIDPVVSYIIDINNNGGISGYYLNYKIYDSKSTVEGSIEGINNIVKDNASLIIGCYINECRIQAASILSANNMTLWYPTIFEGEECFENVFYTGPIANQFLEAITNYLLRESTKSRSLILLGDNRSWSNIMFTIMKNKLETSGYKIYTYNFDSMVEVGNVIKQAIKDTPEGGTFYPTFIAADFITCLNELESNIQKSGMYDVISPAIDRDIINRIKISGKFDLLLSSTYFDEADVNEGGVKEITQKYTGRSFNTMLGEACLLAIKTWVATLKKISPKVLLHNELSPFVYGVEVNASYGPVNIKTNHYSSLYMQMGKLLPNSHNIEIITTQSNAINPMAWNWDLPSSYGYVCDWSNPLIGSRGPLIALRILLAVIETGATADYDVGVKSLINDLVNQYNDKNNGILNKQLYLTSIDIESDVTCFNNIKTQLSKSKYDVIFTTSSQNCIDSVAKYVEDDDIPVISIGYISGETCKENVFYAGREPSTLDRMINVYLKTDNPITMKYSVVGTTDDFSVNSMNYIQKYLNFKKVEVVYSVSMKPEDADYDVPAKEIKSKCTTGCTIIFFGTKTNHQNFDISYKKNGLTFEKYPIFSYSTGVNMIGLGVSQFYSAQSYFPESVTNLTSLIINKQSEDVIFSSKTFETLVRASTSEPITELVSSAYEMFNIWAISVMHKNSTNSSVIKDEMYIYDYQSPEGVVKVSGNNYLSHFLSIGVLNSSGTGFDLIYRSSQVILPVPFKQFINAGTYICDFSQSTIGSQQKDQSVTVGILNSFSGKFEVTERAMTDGIIQGINEINQKGGVLKRKIQIEIRDPQSIDENYLQLAKELGKLDEVKAVFGTGRYAIEMQLAPIFDKHATPFFYPGNSAGEFCSKYTFSLQSTTSQLTHSFEKFILENHDEYIVVQVPTNPYSTISTRSIISRIKITQSILHGPYNTTNFEAMDELDNEVMKRSAIILSVGADGIPPSIAYLCARGITGKTSTILVTTLDQRILDQLDEACVNGMYFFTTFMTEMGKPTSPKGTFIESTEEFVTNMMDSYGSDVQLSAAMEAGYTAVKLWADVIENTYSFDIELARTRMYGYLYRSPTGDLEMNVNGFASRVMYYGVVTNQKSIIIVNYASKPEEGEAYDQYLEENVGYTCDWTDKGDKYELDSIKVIFLHEANNAAREIPIYLEEQTMIKEINYNKINNNDLMGIYIFGNSSEDFDYQLSQYDNDDKVISYIGCRSVSCRQVALKHAEMNKKMFINLGQTEGNYCSKNIINIGTTVYQRLKIAIDYAVEQSVNLFYIVGEKDIESEQIMDVASNYLKEKYSSSLKGSLIEDRILTIDTINTLMSRLSNIQTEEGKIGLVYTFRGKRSTEFLDLLKESGKYTRDMILLFVSYSYYDYISYDLSPFTGSWISVSFHPVLQSALPQSYISDTQDNIGVNSVITEEIEAVKIGLNIWENSIRKGSEDEGVPLPSLDYEVMNIISSENSVPSGDLVVGSDGYSTRSIYLLEINGNGDLNQIHPYRGGSVLNIESHPYAKNTPSECKFGKQNEYYVYNNALYIIYWVLMGLSSFLSVGCLIFTIINRNKKIIRNFGRFYSLFLAIFLLGTSLSAIPIGLYPSESNDICMTRTLLLGLFAKLDVMTMLCKCSKLFQKARRSGNYSILKSKISLVRLLLFIFAGLFIELLLHLLWRYLDPNEYIEVYSQKYSSYFVDEYIRECTISTPFTAIEFTIDGILCLIFLYMSYYSKYVANEFNDSLGLFLSAIITTILGIVLIALDFNINNEPDSVLIFRGIGVQIMVIILCITQYGIKLVNLYLSEDGGKETDSGSAVDGTNRVINTFSTSTAGGQSLLMSSRTMTHTRGYMTLKTAKQL